MAEPYSSGMSGVNSSGRSLSSEAGRWRWKLETGLPAVARSAKVGNWKLEERRAAPGARLSDLRNYQLNRVTICPSRPPGSNVVLMSVYPLVTWKMVLPLPGLKFGLKFVF